MTSTPATSMVTRESFAGSVRRASQSCRSLGLWTSGNVYWLLFLVASAVLGGMFLLRTKGSEFETVYVAASRDLWEGRGLYPSAVGYLYPPFMAWAGYLWTRLSPVWLRLSWAAVNLVSLAALVRGAWRLAGGNSVDFASRAGHLVAWAGFLCGVSGLLNCLAHQQTDVLIGMLLIAGCLRLRADRGGQAATLFGLAAAMKCTALLWVGYLIWRGRHGSAAWLICVALGANLLPDLTCPAPSGNPWISDYASIYLRSALSSNRAPGTWGSDIIYNQSLAGAAQRWFGARSDHPGHAGLLHVGVATVGLGLLASAGWVGGKANTRPADPWPPSQVQALECSLVLILMLLLSPMTSPAHYGTLVLPGFCLARFAHQTRSRWLAGLLAGTLTLLLATNRDLVGRTAYDWALWAGFSMWAAIGLFCGCLVALGGVRGQTGPGGRHSARVFQVVASYLTGDAGRFVAEVEVHDRQHSSGPRFPLIAA